MPYLRRRLLQKECDVMLKYLARLAIDANLNLRSELSPGCANEPSS